MGLFDRLKARLTRTREAISDGISALFRGGRPIDDQLLRELEELLYTSDLGPLAGSLCAELSRLHKRGELKGEEDVRTRLRQMLLDRLSQDTAEPTLDKHPSVILVVGVNGSGKTTSIAKLAHMLQNEGKKVVLGAADTFRAAAVEQLTIWAKRSGAEIVTGPQGADPASVAHRAVARAMESGAEVCIVDTAGRLQTQQNLMQQLTKIHRVLGKLIPEAPHEVLLVLDATTGQNGISQAKHFTEAVRCTGIILAKLDGTAKGGVVVAIRQQVGLPVKYVGVGETLDDLTLFDADSFVDAMFEDGGP